MLIVKCEGAGLEKSSPTSPEDAFNRSTVTFEEGGREKSFQVVYLSFFEQHMNEFTPYEADPVFSVSCRDVGLKDIVALCALIQHPEYRERKRLYVHDEETFVSLFAGLNFAKVQEAVGALEADGSYELESSIVFLNQLG